MIAGRFSPRNAPVLYDKTLKFSKAAKQLNPASALQAACYSTSSGTDDDFLQRSKVPMDHFQKSLPRLPIPELEKTCQRYLKAQQPLLDPDQYKHTETLVNAFKGGDGANLNKELVERDKKNKHTSYISGPWFDMYLKDRVPIVLNYNPFMVFNDDPKPEYNNQLVRATNMLLYSAKFMKTLQANILAPEVFHLNPAKSDTNFFRNTMRLLPKSVSWYGAYLFKAFPLDMSQYNSLFNSTRIPKSGRDELITDPDARHVVVMRNGHFYTFDVLDNAGNIKPATELMANLQYVQTCNAPVPPLGQGVGVLTSENRDTWAGLRDQLLNAGNGDVLSKIDSAMFVLILEDSETDDTVELCRSFLHGKGHDRWFDKSFSLILQKDGRMSVNFEHSWGDGVAVLRYFNETFNHSTKNPLVHPDTTPAQLDPTANVQKLEFKVTPTIEEAIKKAQTTFDATMATLDIETMQYHRFAKSYIKSQKLSPDSIMQLAFQMGYWREWGCTVGTYESCSTAAFKHGRTETMRPCTTATLQASKAFLEKGKHSPSELRAILQECSDTHNALTKDAAMGQGFDRHLFGLRALAAESGKMPEVFQDPAYSHINHNILSTSTLSSPAVLIGGFAPVVPDGYGLGYGVDDDRLGCNVACYPAKRKVTGFLTAVQSSLDDIYEVLEATKK